MNTQKPVTKYHNRGGVLSIHSIFKTIQGEGVFVGIPAIFIRLYGCNLQCPLCDTDYTSSRSDLNCEEILNQVRSLCGSINTVVITGGEPFNQPIGDLIKLLVEEGFVVQIETNGTIFREDIPYNMCTVVCSPKTHYVHPSLQKYIHSYKYVLDYDNAAEDGLPNQVLGLTSRKKVFRPEEGSIIYLQPADEKDDGVNKNNLNTVVDSCLKNNYRLCIQTHKIIGVE